MNTNRSSEFCGCLLQSKATLRIVLEFVLCILLNTRKVERYIFKPTFSTGMYSVSKHNQQVARERSFLRPLFFLTLGHHDQYGIVNVVVIVAVLQ